MKIEHYVEWLTPGSFFAEEYPQKIESRDLSQLKIPTDVYAFMFYDVKTVNAVDEEGKEHQIRTIIDKSPRYIIGEVFTLEQIEAMGKDCEILALNIRQYETKCGVRTHLENWQPLLEDDIVLSRKDVKFTKPVLWRAR